VSDGAARVTGANYVNAMARGEEFFVAVGPTGDVLGFSSHRIDDSDHGTAVYVRGRASRRGIGSALFRAADASARGVGAASIEIDASLGAIDFYRANGFEETGRGAHRLWSGRLMPCVFMRKILA
jgi:putative acetyltransferase